MLFLVKGCMVALHINHTSRTLPEKVSSLAPETEVFTNKFTRNGNVSGYASGTDFYSIGQLNTVDPAEIRWFHCGTIEFRRSQLKVVSP